MTDVYEAHHAGLVGVHRALADAFAPLVAGAHTPLEILVPQARGATSFLLAHHEMESKGLFPGLRRYGKLRSADVAFLDACDREHQALHALCDHLFAAVTALHPVATTITNLARDIMAVLAPHTREEETVLTPERLRLVITEPDFAELGRELEAMRAQLLAKLS